MKKDWVRINLELAIDRKRLKKAQKEKFELIIPTDDDIEYMQGQEPKNL